MNYLQAIERHYQGQEYQTFELAAFVNDYLNCQIDDRLMTKFIKSIYDRDLSIAKLAALTNIMVNSGQTLDLSTLPGIKVDKHSTGGIGDKVSLILGPILASLGVTFAKMSGAGLGFTGGTIDKLKSIPGFKTDLSEPQFLDNLEKYQIAIISQSKNLVPADQKIYALRDVTGLVDSIPLIASSIMAKKIATGADAILLDIKCGNGAFMKNLAQAKLLGQTMIALSKYLKKDVRVEITNMNAPLGKAIGNKNEVLEAMHFLQNRTISDDLKAVVFAEAATMLLQAKAFTSQAEARVAIAETLANGQALAKFKQWILAQGGDYLALTKPSYWLPKYTKAIYAQTEGYFVITSAIIFGKVAMALGAGRSYKEQELDYDAGINLDLQHGAQVKKGQLICTLYSSKPIAQKLVDQVQHAWAIKQTVSKEPILLA